MPDPYYHPEQFGLTTIGEVNWDDESYRFDLTAVWRDASGALYWASDSGCSCPSPFEDITALDQLATGTVDELEAELAKLLAEVKASSYRASNAPRVEGEIAGLIDRVRNGV